MSKTTKRRTVRCPECGTEREIRADSTAVLCKPCGSRRGGKAPKPSRIRGEQRTCDRCSALFWYRPSQKARRFCSPVCSIAARKTADKTAKVNARDIANRAIRAGKLCRLPCEKCGAEPTEMHHEDYSKPLAVTWLCAACHTKLHVARGDFKAK